MNRQHDIEPHWQDEDDWLCTVELLPSDDLEGRVFAADMPSVRAVIFPDGPHARSLR